MVEEETAAMVSRMAFLASTVFAFVGIGLLYLAIVISDASVLTKIIWASGLSLAVATTFLMVWTMASDATRQQEWDAKNKSPR